MNIYSLTEALEDSNALGEIAKRAGVTLAQAKVLCAEMFDLPVVQTIRICTVANQERARANKKR